MKKVLLIFDDRKVSEFIEKNLEENLFHIYVTENLTQGLQCAEKVIPELIVINTFDKQTDLHYFIQTVKTQKLKNVSILALVELESYLNTINKKDLFVKPIKPKLLLSLIRSIMNQEETGWLPAFS